MKIFALLLFTLLPCASAGTILTFDFASGGEQSLSVNLDALQPFDPTGFWRYSSNVGPDLFHFQPNAVLIWTPAASYDFEFAPDFDLAAEEFSILPVTGQEFTDAGATELDDVFAMEQRIGCIIDCAPPFIIGVEAITAAPEPVTWLTMPIGLLCLVMHARKAKKERPEMRRSLAFRWGWLVFYDRYPAGFSFLGDRRIKLRVCTKWKWARWEREGKA